MSKRTPEQRQRHSQKMREWRKKNPDKARAVNLKTKFGITVEDYEEMFFEQNGACAICEQDCPTGRRLAVDHDHATSKVRGLLCSNCNQGLGRFMDKPELLRRAAQYLNRKDQRYKK